MLSKTKVQWKLYQFTGINCITVVYRLSEAPSVSNYSLCRGPPELPVNLPCVYSDGRICITACCNSSISQSGCSIGTQKGSGYTINSNSTNSSRWISPCWIGSPLEAAVSLP